MSKLPSGSLPPIVVLGKRFEDDNDKIYDGHHRVLAAKKRGNKEILAQCVRSSMRKIKEKEKQIIWLTHTWRAGFRTSAPKELKTFEGPIFLDDK